MDHKKIKEKIDAIPSICDKGKEAVAELLKEFGYQPPPKEKIPHCGEVWLSTEDRPFVILQNHTFLYMHSNNVYDLSGALNSKEYTRWKFYASNLKEAFIRMKSEDFHFK